MPPRRFASASCRLSAAEGEVRFLVDNALYRVIADMHSVVAGLAEPNRDEMGAGHRRRDIRAG
jgi:hypothetical protein